MANQIASLPLEVVGVLVSNSSRDVQQLLRSASTDLATMVDATYWTQFTRINILPDDFDFDVADANMKTNALSIKMSTQQGQIQRDRLVKRVEMREMFAKPTRVATVDIRFANSTMLARLPELLGGVTGTITSFSLMTNYTFSPASIVNIIGALRSSRLTHLTVDVTSAVTADDVKAILQSLPTTLQHLELNIRNSNIQQNATIPQFPVNHSALGRVEIANMSNARNIVNAFLTQTRSTAIATYTGV